MADNRQERESIGSNWQQHPKPPKETIHTNYKYFPQRPRNKKRQKKKCTACGSSSCFMCSLTDLYCWRRSFIRRSWTLRQIISVIFSRKFCFSNKSKSRSRFRFSIFSSFDRNRERPDVTALAVNLCFRCGVLEALLDELSLNRLEKLKYVYIQNICFFTADEKYYNCQIVPLFCCEFVRIFCARWDSVNLSNEFIAKPWTYYLLLAQTQFLSL